MTTDDIKNYNESIRSWWRDIANDPRFDYMATQFRATLFEQKLTPDQSDAVNKFIHTMKTLCEPEERGSVMPKPGIHHDLSVTRKTNKPQEKKD